MDKIRQIPAFNSRFRSSWQYSIMGIKSLPTIFHLHTCLKTSLVWGSSRLRNLNKSFKLSANEPGLLKIKLNKTIETAQIWHQVTNLTPPTLTETNTKLETEISLKMKTFHQSIKSLYSAQFSPIIRKKIKELNEQTAIWLELKVISNCFSNDKPRQ